MLAVVAQGESGGELFELVKTYSDMGVHSVGTEVDKQQIKWFSRQFEAIGGQVSLHTFQFDRFVGTSTVTIDGEEIPSMPLYYEAVGTFESDTPHLAALNVAVGDRISPEFEEEIVKAQEAGAELLVVATKNGANALTTPNRHPKLGGGHACCSGCWTFCRKAAERRSASQLFRQN
jgi:hypothetical protein